MRPYIETKRADILKIPSIMFAEYERELDKHYDLEMRMKHNIQLENAIQKEKFHKLKQQYDREGVEFVEDESQMDNKSKLVESKTKPGLRKPGMNRGVHDENLNMGIDNDNLKNPFSMLINAAKKTFNG